ncbi:MAG: hypothetical protein LLF94_05850 [Chlamydiales bacterium]|nr:hypothetical protein [Chlamydiales bacterium]
MKWLILIASVAFLQLHAADLEVDEKIDRAIQFARSGRPDLALTELQRLLQTNLAPVEKATVLYNASVILASSDKYWEAMVALNQIDDAMFNKVVAASPIEAVRIAYNGSLYGVGFAKREILRLIQGASYSQTELDRITDALTSSRSYDKKIAMLEEKKLLGDVPITSFVATTQVQEDIANITRALKVLQTRLSLAELNKTALLDELGGMLNQEFFALLDLYVAAGADSQNIGLYMQEEVNQNVGAITFAIDKLLVFLQAPGKSDVVSMHAYLASEIEGQKQKLVDAFASDDMAGSLSALNQMAFLVQQVQAEVSSSETTTFLDARTEIAMEYSLAKDAKLVDFWHGQWQETLQAFLRFIAFKESHSNSTDAAFYGLLQKRIEAHTAVPSVQTTVEDTYYWKILTQKTHKTYLDLATELHGAHQLDITNTIHALRDRLIILEKPEAIKALDTTPLFQNIILSWFYVEPDVALAFIINLVADEATALHTNQQQDSAIAKSDFQLLLHLLELSDSSVAHVREDLAKKQDWFTTKEKKDFDFFTMSLELGWLKEVLTGSISNFEGITTRVDFGVDFQKKTLTLLRYNQEPQFQPTIDLLSEMQEHTCSTTYDALSKLPTRGPKIQQATNLVQDAVKNAKVQNNNLSNMHALLEDLEQASKILHSLQSESNSSNSKESKSKQDSQDAKPSQDLKKQTLKLSPELSIRLLQEMEKEDQSLKEQIIPQVNATRPW